jgi:hypothetical protein
MRFYQSINILAFASLALACGADDGVATFGPGRGNMQSEVGGAAGQAGSGEQVESGQGGTVSGAMGNAGTIQGLAGQGDSGTSGSANQAGSGTAGTTSGTGGGGGAAAGGTSGAGGMPEMSGNSGSSGNSGASGSNQGAGGVGTTCNDIQACSDKQTMVCSPTSQTCVVGECGEGKACPSAEAICVGQISSPTIGACYSSCEAYTGTACGSGKECVPLGLDGGKGVCFGQGSAKDGESCASSKTSLSTGCAAGLRCVNEGMTSVCHQQCNLFATEPGCKGQQRCTLGGHCSSDPTGHLSPLGTVCPPTATSGDRCGNDGKAWRGLCIDDDQSPATAMLCMSLCRLNSDDCYSWEQCVNIYQDASIGIGVCISN